VKKYLILEVKN